LKGYEKELNMRRVLTLFLLFLFFTLSALYAQDIILSTAKPQDVAMDEDILKAGVRLYEKAVHGDELKGVVLLVARHGKVVLHEAIGWRNKEQKLPMEKNTMFRMASNTKPVIATAISMLVEEKKLSYDDNVRKYFPSFDNYRSGFIKIRHLLTHTSGFRINTLFLNPLMEKSEQHPDAPNLKLEAARFGEVGAEEIPGTTYDYSNPGFNTLGALIEIASGQELEVFLKEQIYKPLGMVDSYNHEIAEKLDGKLNRMSVVYRKRNEGWRIDWKPGDPPTLPFVRASGGMISTAWDYAIFCQMFLNKGIYNGKRLLKTGTVELMTSPQTAHIYSEKEKDSFYGYGWSVSNEGIFSRGGSDGTFAWVDPNRQIIGLIFTQSPGGKNPRDKFMELVNDSIID
jgi:CubicO group peptidase (beta-lactamase class C family)